MAETKIALGQKLYGIMKSGELEELTIDYIRSESHFEVINKKHERFFGTIESGIFVEDGAKLASIQIDCKEKFLYNEVFKMRDEFIFDGKKKPFKMIIKTKEE